MATVSRTPRSTTIQPTFASAGPFQIGFRLFDADGITVYINGGMISPTEYTVLFTPSDGYDDSASVLFSSPIPSGSRIRIEGTMWSGRGQDYVPTDRSVWQKINVEFGRVWANLLELVRDTRSSLRVGQNVPIWTPTENTIPVWDGEKFVGAPYLTSIADIADLAERAEAAAQIISGGTRANFVAMNTLGSLSAFPDGSSVMADGLLYKRSIGSAVIPDLPGWVPGGGVTSLAHFDIVGDGIANDTVAWNAFQAAPGMKEIPPGQYLVDGAVKRFDQGVLGNGVFNDSSPPNYNFGYWDQVWGQRNANSLIVHYREIDGNSPPPMSPAIKIQQKVRYDYTGSAGSAPDFARGVGGYFETIGEGDFNTDSEARTGNIWGFGSTCHNKFAGRMGMAAIIGRTWDARESEVPNINVYGSSKSTGAGFQVHRRSRFANGAYMIAMEAYVANRADETLDIPYVNDDSIAFEDGGTTMGVHIKVRGGDASYKGAPISAGMVLSGAAGARHGCYNGIVIGGGAFQINNNGDGAPGTVGITLASWREGRHGEIGIKFRRANRHLWFREGARIQSNVTRFLNEDGGCNLTIEASGSAGANSPSLILRDSTDSSFSPNARDLARFDAFPGYASLQSVTGELRLSASGGDGLYIADSARFGPANSQDNTKALGGPARRWSEVFAGTGTINTSDERKKSDVAPIDDAALDAWAEVEYAQYRMRDAVEKKGEGARLHTGVIAQRVIEAFERHGLDARSYGLLCYDEWEAQPERREVTRISVKPPVYEQVLLHPARTETIEVEPGVFEDEEVPAEYTDGDIIEPEQFEEREIVTPAIEAGNIYGIRYEEALCFEAAYQRRRADRMETRLAAIEALLSIEAN